jgi:hypothetical protein
MSSVTLAETLAESLGMSCQLAWPMLHRYRVTMVRADRAPLVDEVKVDETVAAGSVVLTDGWGGYKACPSTATPTRRSRPRSRPRHHAECSPGGEPAHKVGLRYPPGLGRSAPPPGILGSPLSGSTDPPHVEGACLPLAPCAAVFTGPVTEAEVTRRYPWSDPHKMPGYEELRRYPVSADQCLGGLNRQGPSNLFPPRSPCRWDRSHSAWDRAPAPRLFRTVPALRCRSPFPPPPKDRPRRSLPPRA